MIRLLEEDMESLRRRKVIAGEWSEKESNQKLKEHMEERRRKMPTYKQE